MRKTYLPDGSIQSGSVPYSKQGVLSKEDACSADKVSNVVTAIAARVTEIERSIVTRTVEYQDVPVTGSTLSPKYFAFRHGFGCRVRWYIVDIESTGSVSPTLRKEANKCDADTLVLRSHSACTVTIRVEAVQ